MTSHPLYLTWYPLYLCHHIHCIDDITPNQFLRSHPLYMTTSYPFYMTSQPMNACHHTNYFNDITPFVCRTSNPLYVRYHTLYKAPHPDLMISHHIIYDITCTVFITSPSLYQKGPLPYLCHHSDSIDALRPKVCMTSHPLYVHHRLHSTQRYIHSFCLHTIVVMTSHLLHS